LKSLKREGTSGIPFSYLQLKGEERKKDISPLPTTRGD